MNYIELFFFLYTAFADYKLYKEECHFILRLIMLFFICSIFMRYDINVQPKRIIVLKPYASLIIISECALSSLS